ncbi:MAG: large repetitive protein [Frankiaceae bacterium]|jgi:hypothetical protein|nr:large repetitive protein [Frankiaceae bacterium]
MRALVALCTAAALAAPTGTGPARAAAGVPAHWRMDVANPASQPSSSMVWDPAARQVVMVGISTGPYSGPSPGAAWTTTDGRRWVRPASPGPDARAGASLVYDAARQQVVLFGGDLTGVTWTWNGQRWTQYTGPGPRPRSEATMVYDAARRQVVLFGGAGRDVANAPELLDDTWTWDGKAWTQRSADGPTPPPRRGALMVDDPATRQVLLVGGTSDPEWHGPLLSDTWTWNGTRWARAALTELPARLHGGMVYDPARRTVVLFGGDDNRFPDTKYLGDTWTWNGTRWKQAPAGPAPRTLASLAYDEARRRVVLFGGRNANSDLGDTWTWDGGRWTRATAAGPQPRRGAGLVWSGTVRGLLAFGGATDTGSSVNDRERSDTWLWDGRRWLPRSAPMVRTQESIVYDEARREVVLFGGSAQSEERDDTWTWDGTAWWPRTGPRPPRRTNASMVYDPATRQVVLFGGYAYDSDANKDRYFADTWVWDGKGWKVAATTGPAGRAYASMVYDARSRRVVLFGGTNAGGSSGGYGGYLGDTWTWDGKRWTKAAASGPPARAKASVVYDAAARHVVLFGGLGLDGLPEVQNTSTQHDPYLDDTWTWDGARWTEVPGAGPAGRTQTRLVYDAAARQVVLFGGWGNPPAMPRETSFEQWLSDTVLGDTWVLEGTRWRQVTTQGPTARRQHAMAYDPVTREIVLFGGYGDTQRGSPEIGLALRAATDLGDTWAWDGHAWSPRSGAAPSPRHDATLVYDARTGRLVLCGGAGEVADTWTW